MLKCLKILFSFLLLYIACFYAKDMQDEQGRMNVRKQSPYEYFPYPDLKDPKDRVTELMKNTYIKDLRYSNILIDSYAIENGKYYIVTMQNFPSDDDFGRRVGLYYNCIEVFKDVTLIQKFCYRRRWSYTEYNR